MCAAWQWHMAAAHGAGVCTEHICLERAAPSAFSACPQQLLPCPCMQLPEAEASYVISGEGIGDYKVGCIAKREEACWCRAEIWLTALPAMVPAHTHTLRCLRDCRTDGLRTLEAQGAA